MLLACLAGACGDDTSKQDPEVAEGRASLPEGWDQELALTRALDRDPAPNVVDVELDARVSRVEVAPGREIEAWTYAGQSPGPLLRAKVGDTLRVHFTNNLPEPTTIHWHGLEVPADQDGAGEHGSTVAPGETFHYQFTLRHAGTYWYHPHYNSTEQVWRGLYGALIVDDQVEPELGDELTLLLHDLDFDQASGEIDSTDELGELGRFFGNEGHTLLVNGRVQPTAFVHPGSTLRLRVINTSVSRYYRLAIEGQKLTRVAGDSGFSERAQLLDDVLLVPGQRSELMLSVPADASGELLMRALPHARFLCADCGEGADLMRFAVVPGSGQTRMPPASLARIEPIDTSAASQRTLTLSQTTREGHTALAINDHAYGYDTLMLHAHVNSTELWTIVNDTDYDHPFHLHGFRFQVRSEAGRAPAVGEWRDTTNVAARTKVELAVFFDDRPGSWMFHCHILDHAELGMMGMLHVE